MVRYHVMLSGRVQGVGFRFVTTSIAKRYQVTGWVANCYDGRVEIEVQGDVREVEAFLAEIRQGDRYIRIDTMDIDELPALKAGKEKGFTTRYY